MVNDFARERLRPLAPGVLLAFASIAFGFGLGIAFGAAEDDLKDHLRESAQAVMESVYSGDESKAKPVVSKSWTYFKRAHLHANGLGAIALAVILLLALLGHRVFSRVFRRLASEPGRSSTPPIGCSRV